MRKQLNNNPQLVNINTPGCQFVETRNKMVARTEFVGLASSNRCGYDLQKGEPRPGAIRP